MKVNRIAAMSSRLALATTFVAVAALILACGSSYPSESTGRRFLEAVGKSGGFTVKSFTKTNGIGDDKHYTIEYKAECECHKVNWQPGAIIVGTLANYAVLCKEVGQVVSASGTMDFQKTENGWKGPDDQIY